MDYKKLIIAALISLLITDIALYAIAKSRNRQKTGGFFITD